MRLPVRLLSVSYFFVFALILFHSSASFSQCSSPSFYDLNFANPTQNPTWVRCIADESTIDPSYTFSVVTPSTLSGYQIDFGDGSPKIIGSLLPAFTTIDHNYTALGQYFVTITNTVAGCPLITTNGIFINDRNPKPSINNSLAPITNFCIPRTLTFIGSNINASPTTVYTWGWGDGLSYTTTLLGAFAHTYTSPGFTGCGRSITLTAQSLCSTPPLNQPPVTATLGTTYSFWSTDQIAFTLDKIFFCSGDPINFQDVSIWNCQNTQVRQVRWFSTTPGYAFDLGYKSALPPARKLTRTFTGGVGTIISVCLIDSNYCGKVMTCSTVQIVNPPIADFNVNTPNICIGNPASFSNASTGNPDLFNINFGDGSGWKSFSGSSTSPILYTYTLTGTYTVTGVAARLNSKICTDTIRKIVTVFPSPVSNFILSPTTACGLLNVNAVDVSTLASSIIWDFGINTTISGTSGGTQLSPTYTLPGIYTISSTAISNIGCTNVKTATVTLFSNIIWNSTATSVCLGSPTYFTDLSQLQYPDPTNGLTRIWNGGIGSGVAISTNSVLIGTYPNPGTFIVTLTVTSGRCSASGSFPYTVYSNPKAKFVSSAIIGCNPLNVTLSNTSTGASSFIWKFSDATPNINVTTLGGLSKSFINYTTNTVSFSGKLIAITSNNCKDSTSTTFNVNPGPIAAFTPSPTQAQCSPAPISIINNTIGANIFTWNMGDGNTISTTGLGGFNYSLVNNKGILVYDTITLSATSPTGCIGTTYKIIPVFPDPGLGIGASYFNGCSPLSVQFYSTATAINLQWDFGDGTQSNIGTPSKTFLNTSALTTTFGITLSGQSVYGCQQTVTSFITLNPKPNAAFSLSPGLTGCTPFIPLIVNGSLGTLTSNWSFGDGTPSTVVGLSSFSYGYYNSTSFNQYFPLKLKVNNQFNCSDSIIQNIIVLPKVTSGFVATNLTGCTPLNVGFTSSSTNAGIFLWNFGDGTTASGINVAKIFTNTTSGILTFDIQLTAKSLNCQDISLQTVTVYPKPKADYIFTGVNQGCSPLNVGFQNNSLGTVTSNWTFGDGGPTTVLGTNTFSYQYNNPTSFSQTYAAKLRVDNNFGCSDSISKNVTVSPILKSGFTPSVLGGCGPLSVVFTNTSTNAGVYAWDFGDGTTSSSQNFGKTYTNTTSGNLTFDIQLTAKSLNCQDISLQTVTVYPKPKADYIFTGVNQGCSPLNVGFQNNSLGTLTSNWTFGDGGPTTVLGTNTFSYQYLNPTSFTQTYSAKLRVDNNFGCSDSISKNVTVSPILKSGFTPSVLGGCGPLSVVFTNTSTNAGIYAWNFGDGTTSSSQNFGKTYTNTTSGNITFDIQLTSRSLNCQDILLQTVTVYPKPKADYIFTGVNQGCSPLNVGFQNNSLGTLTSNWTFGDGGPTTVLGTNTFSYQYNNPTSFSQTYASKLRVDNNFGCSDSISKNVTVSPILKSGFTPSVLGGCGPLSVVFTNTSTNAGVYTWDFGDGTTSSSQNFGKTYTNTTSGNITFDIQLTAKSLNCQDISLQTVTVYPKPKADYIFTGVNQGCSPLNVGFQNNSLGTLTSNWTFGDGGPTTVLGTNTFSYQYNNPTSFTQTYSAKLRVDNNFGCSDSISKNVTVSPILKSGFTPSVLGGCGPLSVVFTNTSTNAGVYAWDFGDGTTSSSQNFGKTYTNTTSGNITFDIQLTAKSLNCQDISLQTVTVYPKPKADYIFTGVNQGCSPLNVGFQNNSLGTLTSNWTFGDGGPTTVLGTNTFSYQYNNPTSFTQTYSAKLRVDNNLGCSDSISKNVTVSPILKSGFTPSVLGGCGPLSVVFTNTSTNAGVYTWDFGDGTTSSSQNFGKTYTNTTSGNLTFDIQLTAKSLNCQDISLQTVTVYPKPKADYIFTGVNQGCSPLNVGFQNNSLGTLTSNWTFGDGGPTTVLGTNTFSYQYNNPTSFSQTYAAKLRVDNNFGCSDSTTKNVTAYPNVQAGFTASNLSGCSPLTINLFNESTNSGSYLWDLGDGNTSTSQNFSKLYTNTTLGVLTFNINLTAKSTNCSDVYLQTLTVYPKPTAGLSITSAIKGCVPFEVNFQNNSFSYSNAIFDYSDGSQESNTSVLIKHSFTIPGKNFTVKMLINNSFNCKDSSFVSVSTFPAIKANFNMSDSVNCTPLKVNFNDFSEGVSQYYWDFGAFGNSNSSFPTKIFTTSNLVDTNKVKLIVTSSVGCKDSLTKKVIVRQAPTSLITTTQNFECSPFNVDFVNSSVNAVNSTWDFGDSSPNDNSNALSLPHKFLNNSGAIKSYKVKLITSNGSSCSSADSTFISVYPSITASISSDIIGGCSPLTVLFTNTTPGAKVYSWDFENGKSGVGSESQYTFENNLIAPKNFQIRFVGISIYGCTDTANTNINVNPAPKINFSATNNQGCTPLSVRFFNNSIGNVSNLWDFGFNTSILDNSATIDRIYTNTTTSLLSWRPKLTIQNLYGCRATDSVLVALNPNPKASFTTSLNQGCAPLLVNFNNTSSQLNSVKWLYGDGFVDNSVNGSHTFSNVSEKDSSYTVKLIVYSPQNCTDTISKSIKVWSKPNPNFDFYPSPTVQNSPVSIINYTAGNWSNYFWNFGDEQASFLKNPNIHNFSKVGTYLIDLKVVSSNGCKDSTSKQIVVVSSPPVARITGSGVGCGTVDVSFQNLSEYGDSFIWDFGDGSPQLTTNTTSSVSHTFTNSLLLPKTYSITVKATGLGGSSYALLKDNVLVNPIPVADFVISPNDTLYQPDTKISITNLTNITEGTLWNWDFGNGITSTEKNPINTFVDEGSYLVTLTATSMQGCVNETMVSKTVLVVGNILKMPNAFTPNISGSQGNTVGLGINDVFGPGFITDVSDYSLTIFNKWGIILFESKNPAKGWDGYFNGQLCQEDLYVYKVKARLANGQTKEMTGEITLLHK